MDVTPSIDLDAGGGLGDIMVAAHDFLPPEVPPEVPLELDGVHKDMNDVMMESAGSLGSSGSNGFNAAMADAAGGAAALMALPPMITPSAEEAALALATAGQTCGQPAAVASDLALAQQPAILQQLAREQQLQLQVMRLAQLPALGAVVGCGAPPQLWLPGGVGTGLQPGCSPFLPPASASTASQLEGHQAAATADDTGAGSGGGSKQCPSCSQLEAEGNKLHLQLQGQADAQTPAAELAKQVAGFVVRVATQCQHSDGGSGSRPPCLAQLQLPDDAESCWHVTLPKARMGDKGRQRAAARTATARQFNFHANSPCPLVDASLQQLLRQGCDAADAASYSYYSIRSKDRNIVAQALVRLPGTDDGAPQADPCCHLWSPRLIKCSKQNHKLRGTEFDGFRWCFVSIGARQPQKRKAAAAEGK